MNCKTAEEMLVKLSTIYDRDNEQQKCNLLQGFFIINMKKVWI